VNRGAISALSRAIVIVQQCAMSKWEVEWMYGDCATGAIGFHELAHLNPFRWSGPISFLEAISQLESAAETSSRPILLKIPAGVTTEAVRLETIEEAILHIRTVKVEWMFADAGSGIVGINLFARFNPLRWSGSMTSAAAISQLEEVARKEDRPIILKMPPGVFSQERQFDTIQGAIAHIRSISDVPLPEESISDVPLPEESISDVPLPEEKKEF